MRTSFLHRLRRDDSGTSVMEFGLIAPVLAMVVMGTMDAGHTIYMRSVLNGAMQRAGRDSALEGGGVTAQQTAIDGRVRAKILQLANNATITTRRRYYRTFSEASAQIHEDFTDTNANQICDDGEPYIDANVNGTFDEDGGDDGQGGAKDVVIITSIVDYKRLFPMAKLIGLPETVHMEANCALCRR
jgi:Flp pilus assembly protein TadG